MLNRLITAYFIIALLIYGYFWFSTSSDFVSLYFYHFVVFVFYASTLYFISKKTKGYFTKANLLALVFIVSFIIVYTNNYVSYIYNSNLFVFSEVDAVNYYYHSLNMASRSMSDAISYYLSFYSVEDLGAVLISSTLYRIIESKLFLNFFYIIVGLFTALGIYRISFNFMSVKYAFICSVSYSLSSFVLWFHSSGLKESFMCMLIVLFFDRYYVYLKNKNILQLAYASLFLAALLLFRPALIFFCLGGVGMGLILQRRKGLTGVFVIVLLFAGFIALYPVFESTYNRFLMGGDLNRLLLAKQSMIVGGTQFTYAVNLMAQLIGPLPTISPDVGAGPKLSFYPPGLIFKILLSGCFWLGVYYIFKYKFSLLYPLIFFAFFEMISLLLILEGLELRKSLPHFAMIFIIAFWFLDKYDIAGYFRSKRSRQYHRLILNFYCIVIFIVIMIWNIRGQVI